MRPNSTDLCACFCYRYCFRVFQAVAFGKMLLEVAYTFVGVSEQFVESVWLLQVTWSQTVVAVVVVLIRKLSLVVVILI